VDTLTHLVSRIPRLERFADSFSDLGKGFAFSLLYVGFLVLDLVCLYGFIVPYFQG